MSSSESVRGLRGGSPGELWARGSVGSWLAGSCVVGAVGLSTVFTAAWVVQADTPTMTSGRKRVLALEILPVAMPVVAALAAVGLGLAAWRCRSLAGALFGPSSERATPGGRVARVGILAFVVAGTTPLLQALCGAPVETAPTRLFDTPTTALVSALGLLAAAVQEDAALRWLPCEITRVAAASLGSRGSGPVVLAVVASASLATLAHAARDLGWPTTDALSRYGLPKAPGAVVFALSYTRRGAVEAWLTHAATNLFILLLVPALVGRS